MSFIETGNGIILFHKYIIHLIGKYSISKQINLFKISFSINNPFHNLLLKKTKIPPVNPLNGSNL